MLLSPSKNVINPSGDSSWEGVQPKAYGSLSARVTFRHVGKAAMSRGGGWFHEEWWCTPAQARHKQTTIQDLDMVTWLDPDDMLKSFSFVWHFSSGFYTYHQFLHTKSPTFGGDRVITIWNPLVNSDFPQHNPGFIYIIMVQIWNVSSAMCSNFAQCHLRAVVHSLLSPFPIRFIWAALQLSSITWMAAFLK